MRLKYHSWILLILCSVLFQAQSFILAIGFLIGYLHSQNLFNEYYNFSNERVSDIENSCVIEKLKTFTGFVTVQMAQAYTYELREQIKPSDISREPDNMLLSGTAIQVEDLGNNSDDNLDEQDSELKYETNEVKKEEKESIPAAPQENKVIYS